MTNFNKEVNMTWWWLFLIPLCWRLFVFFVSWTCWTKVLFWKFKNSRFYSWTQNRPYKQDEMAEWAKETQSPNAQKMQKMQRSRLYATHVLKSKVLLFGLNNRMIHIFNDFLSVCLYTLCMPHIQSLTMFTGAALPHLTCGEKFIALPDTYIAFSFSAVDYNMVSPPLPIV